MKGCNEALWIYVYLQFFYGLSEKCIEYCDNLRKQFKISLTMLQTSKLYDHQNASLKAFPKSLFKKPFQKVEKERPQNAKKCQKIPITCM